MHHVKRLLYFVLGSIALVAGLVGIVVPILPTTPLLLMAAACFLKSSRRMYVWLMSHKQLGPLLYQYSITKAIPLRTKRRAILLVWIGIAISIVLIGRWQVALLLLSVAIGVTLHIAYFKTMKEEERRKAENAYADFILQLETQHE